MDSFEEAGYCVITLSDPSPIHEMRVRLLEELRGLIGDIHVTLENYHEFIGENDDEHIAIQFRLTEMLREHKWHLPIFQKNLSLFADLVGPDLDVQSAPYLRIVRPGKTQDNIGYHRDTVYGGSPYELSVFVPYVELEAGAALCVEPGSHSKGEPEIPFVRMENPDKGVVKGSMKHKIGYPYAPQVLEETYPLNMLPIPLHIGQVLAFSLATLHGTIMNTSATTRWTSDVRVKNAFAPVGTRASADIYMALARSRATKAAQKYLRANERQDVSANEKV